MEKSNENHLIIDKKIISQKVLNNVSEENEQEEQVFDVMHEGIERDNVLQGSTYKFKVPNNDHAFYVTINDIILNKETEKEEIRPYEIFINSKNMQDFQWILALTRLISGVFRKGGDIAFISEELKAVFDPNGGHFERGTYIPSTVAKIGTIIEKHFMFLGLIQKEELTEEQKTLIEEKKKQLGENIEEWGYPDTAILCPKCSVKAAVVTEGCLTCLSCAWTKCG